MRKLIGLTVALVLIAAPAKAQAAWTTLESGYGGVFLACKTPESGGYGPVWKITLVLATAQGGPQAAARFTVRRPRAGGGFDTVSELNFAAAGGAWDVKTTYASRLGSNFSGAWHPDQWAAAASFNPNTGGTNAGTFGQIGSC